MPDASATTAPAAFARTFPEPTLPLDEPDALAVSPDGSSVYVAAASAEAITVFNRLSPAGQLVYAECLDRGRSASCRTAGGPPGAFSFLSALAISPEGNSVYASGAGPAASPDPLTSFRCGAPSGELDFAECISEAGSGGACAAMPGGAPLNGAIGIAVSPDGASVYVATDRSNTVTTFRRSPQGQLTFAGCISSNVSGGACAALPGGATIMLQPGSVSVSPDGTSVYVGAFLSSTLIRFARKTSLPETTIESGPAEGSSTADRKPSFSFSSSEPGASFECSIDGGAFNSCGSPTAIGPLSPGRHSFAVRARADGDTDPTPASRSFFVSPVGPPSLCSIPDRRPCGSRGLPSTG